MSDLVERLRARAATLERLGRENRPLTTEGDVAICVLTREHLHDAADEITRLRSRLAEAEEVVRQQGEALNALIECFGFPVKARTHYRWARFATFAEGQAAMEANNKAHTFLKKGDGQ